MRATSRIALVLSIATLAALIAASGASATVFSSQIATPAGTTFTTFDQNNPNSIEVSGTVVSDDVAGDELNVDCFSGAQVFQIATAVQIAGDGSFLVQAASLEKVASHVCRLRAVPTGAVPANLAPFEGPLLASGRRLVETLKTGEYAGQPSGFNVNDQQLGAADSFASLGRCGLLGAELHSAGFEATTTTFACNDWFWRFDNHEEPTDSTRSQIQVDGVNAYTARVVNEMYGGVKGFPAVTVSVTQDPLTGDMEVRDSESLVACLTPAYPPSIASCPTFVNTGIRDERTIEQTDDGHLVTITDRYASTDGQTHSLDLLPENVQQFAGPTNENGEAIAYRFPGESAYSVHPSGEVVPFAADLPGTVLIRVEGAVDGDQTAGRGAIVFAQPATPATFNELNGSYSGFYFHQAASVPAGGDATFQTAYAQGYAGAEVEALAGKAESAFRLPPQPGPPPTPQQQPAPAQPAGLRLIKAKLDKRKGTATLLAQVSGPGTLVLSGKRLVGQKGTARGVEVVKLTVRSKGKAKKALAKVGKATVKAVVTFTPQSGVAIDASRSITLKKQLNP